MASLAMLVLLFIVDPASARLIPLLNSCLIPVMATTSSDPLAVLQNAIGIPANLAASNAWL